MEQNGSTTTAQANQKVSETDRLFPDLLPADEATPLPVEAAKTETESKKEEVSPTPKPIEPEYLDIQGFGDKKVKVKVDGVETEIPFKDVVKGYQTEQYLTRKGQMLAEEKKKLQEVAPPTHSDDEYIDPLMVEKVRSLEKQIESANEVNKAILSDIMPIRYEPNLSVIDTEMKAEGLTDFKEKVPEIEKIILAMPADKVATYDTIDGFKFLYKNLKLQEFTKKPQVSTTANPDVRPKPKVVPIESSSSPSGGVASTSAERDNAMALAKKSGDWTNFFVKYG